MADQDNRLCPFTKENTSKCPQCLSFSCEEQEWSETEVRPNPKHGRMEEVFTGNLIRGRIAQCQLGVFKKQLVSQEVVGAVDKETGEKK